MRKIRQFITSLLSLFFILISNIVFSQSNIPLGGTGNPLDITNKELYYKTLNNDEIIDWSYIFVNTESKKALSSYSNHNNEKLLLAQDVDLYSNNNYNYVLIDSESKDDVKWYITESEKLFNKLTQSYLVVASPASEKFNFIDSYTQLTILPRNFWSFGYNSLINKHVFSKNKIIYSNGSFSLSSQDSNVDTYKKLDFEFEDMTVDEFSIIDFDKTTNYGSNITYSIINHSSSPDVNAIHTDLNNVINFVKIGTVNIVATVDAKDNIPSFKKMITVTIINGRVDCFNEYFNGRNSVESSRGEFMQSHKFNRIAGEILVGTGNGKLKMKSESRIESQILSNVLGNVTLKIKLTGRNSSNKNENNSRYRKPKIQIGFLDESNNEYGILEYDISRSGNDSNYDTFPTNILDYYYLEIPISNIKQNSKLFIYSPKVLNGLTSYSDVNNTIYIEELEFICEDPGVTIWQFNKWSNRPPNSTTKAIVRQQIEQHVLAKELTIEENVELPTDKIFKVIDKFSVKQGISMNFNKGSYLVLEPHALVEGVVGFKTNTKLYKTDTRIFSSPVENQIIRNDTIGFVNKKTRIFKVNTNGSWANYTTNDTTPFPKGIGLGIQRTDGPAYNSNNVVNPQQYDGIFVGKPINENFEVPISKENNGFYSLGNPYTMPLDIKNFLTENVNVLRSIRIWKNENHWDVATGSYLTTDYWVNCTATGCDEDLNINKVDVGVGFVGLISNNAPENPKVKFNNEVKAKDFNLIFENNRNQEIDNKARFILELKDSQVTYNSVLLGYMPNATNGYNELYDLEVSNFGDNYIAILKDNALLKIAGKEYPLNTDDIINLSFKTDKSDQYVISLKGYDGDFTSNQPIFLKDKNENVIHDLKISDYSFFAEVGQDEQRFEIIFKNSLLNTNDEIKDGLKIVKDKDEVLIKSSFLVKQYEIYNIEGLRIAFKDNVNESNFNIKNLESNKIYLIKVITNDGKIYNRKILF